MVGKKSSSAALNQPRKVDSPFARNGHSKDLFRSQQWEPAGSNQRRDVLARAAEKTVSTILQRFGMTSMTPVPGGKEEITTPLTDSWVIYACITAISEAVRSVPLQVRPNADPKSKPLDDTDDMVKLLHRPHTGMSWSEMVEADAVHRKLSGESFWFLMDGAGDPIFKPVAGAKLTRNDVIDIPVQILPVNGNIVQDERDTEGHVVNWWYTGGLGTAGQAHKFPWSSVLQFRNYDPNDPERGLGQTFVALRAANVAFQAERYQEAVLRAGGPGAYLAYKDEEFSEGEERRLQDKVDEANRNPDRIGGLQVLTGNVEVTPNPAMPKDMITKESQAWYRDVVCSIFGVPPPVIGIFDRAIYNNIAEAFRQFWGKIRTYLDSVADTLNTRFFPRLKDKKFAQYRATFDYSAVPFLREDESDKMVKAADIAALRIGLSFNAAARLLGVRAELPPEGEVVTQDPSARLKPDPNATNPNDKPPKASLQSKRTPKLNSQDERSTYVDSFHARITAKHERRIAGRVLGWQRSMERAYVERLREFAATGTPPKKLARALGLHDQIEQMLVLNEAKWADKLRRAVEAQLEAAYYDALADAASELGVVQIDQLDPRILRQLQRQATKLSEGVTSTVTNKVRKALFEGLADGTSQASLQARVIEQLPELTDELRRVFGNKESRAATIARTETNKATTNARILQMLEAGVTEIQWLSSRDGHVRKSHEELDGQTRTIGEEFKPNLRWPDDENGPPEEVINCRCVPKAIVEG